MWTAAWVYATPNLVYITNSAAAELTPGYRPRLYTEQSVEQGAALFCINRTKALWVFSCITLHLRQMAARETGFGAVEAYMHQGKLLALDLVVRLLENPLQVGNRVLGLGITGHPAVTGWRSCNGPPIPPLWQSSQLVSVHEQKVMGQGTGSGPTVCRSSALLPACWI